MTAVTRITTAIRGQLATNQIAIQKDTKVSEEASAEIPFGVAVRRGTADDGMLLMSANTQKPCGILICDGPFAKDNELGDTGLKPKVVGDVVVRGRVYVWAESAMNVGDAVHVRVTANGGNTQTGTFLPLKDTNKTIDISAFARVVQSGDATNPPVIEVDMLFAAQAVVS